LNTAETNLAHESPRTERRTEKLPEEKQRKLDQKPNEKRPNFAHMRFN